MKKMIFTAVLWLSAASLGLAQNPPPSPGEKAGNDIAERVESQETASSDQKALVKEIAEAARKAGKDNPNDADKVKEIVRKKLDDIRDRQSSKDKPGGKNNSEINEWVKKLKRELMDNKYISLPRIADTPLVFTAKGTGRTTGHIANLQIFNPTDLPISTEVGACFIPSSGQYQPYIVPYITPVTIQPHSNATVALHGYCTDIFTAPEPNGNTMKPISAWQTSDQSPEAAALIDAIVRISTSFETLKEAGAISTPFSANPEKEREAVIQQTFWRYTAVQAGKQYKEADFRENTIKQFEASTGQKFKDIPIETQKSVDKGVKDFWNTFEAVGVDAKVLTAHGQQTTKK